MTAFGGPAWLFCPADRPERFAKALDRADVVILDLEDAVPPSRKEIARHALLKAELDLDRVVVRVNERRSEHQAADLETVRRMGARRIMVPKAEGREDLEHLDYLDLVPLCESARGILAASELASMPRVWGLMWGAEDLIKSTGGIRSRNTGGEYYDLARYARAHVFMAARAAGVEALDAIYADFKDVEGLKAEATQAFDAGFAAKACIHPVQVETIREAFTPDQGLVDWACRVVEAGAHGGAASVDSQMIDAPLVAQAERILAAGRASKLT